MNEHKFWLRSDLLLLLLIICLLGLPVMIYFLPSNSQTLIFLGIFILIILITTGVLIFLNFSEILNTKLNRTELDTESTATSSSTDYLNLDEQFKLIIKYLQEGVYDKARNAVEETWHLLFSLDSTYEYFFEEYERLSQFNQMISLTFESMNEFEITIKELIEQNYETDAIIILNNALYDHRSLLVLAEALKLPEICVTLHYNIKRLNELIKTISQETQQYIEIRESELLIEEKQKCPYCGILISSSDILCPVCNKPIQECPICRGALKDTNGIRKCPFCNSYFHKGHLYEWIRIKHSCPVCRNRLTQNQTI